MSFFLTFFLTASYSWGLNFESSGEALLQSRYYPQIGLFQNHQQSELVLQYKPEFSWTWDDDLKQIIITPFFMTSSLDEEKNNIDLREAYFLAAYDFLEIKVGVAKVFWGVTESLHLVDIINQTDLIVNLDGENKLGQPMVNLTWPHALGTLDLFILPYFRERTFPGRRGRFNASLPIDTKQALFEDSNEEKHIDMAGRSAHTWGNLDFALSFFHGTDREPLFNLSSDFSKLTPYYIQSTQIGLEAQYIFESWLFKLETIRKWSKKREDYNAFDYGFEYTFSNIKSTGVDLGILFEHIYDSRKTNLAFFKNHFFAGQRLVLNDEKSTEFLFGLMYNYKESDLTSLRLEGNRRISDNWKWFIEAQIFIDSTPEEFVYNFRRDDYLQFTLAYYY